MLFTVVAVGLPAASFNVVVTSNVPLPGQSKLTQAPSPEESAPPVVAATHVGEPVPTATQKLFWFAPSGRGQVDRVGSGRRAADADLQAAGVRIRVVRRREVVAGLQGTRAG